MTERARVKLWSTVAVLAVAGVFGWMAYRLSLDQEPPEPPVAVSRPSVYDIVLAAQKLSLAEVRPRPPVPLPLPVVIQEPPPLPDVPLATVGN